MRSNWSVKFKGEILPGFDIESAKKDFAGKHGYTAEETKDIFSGTVITLKQDLPKEEALQYQSELSKLGMITYIGKSVPAGIPKQKASKKPEERAKAVKPPAVFSLSFEGRYGRLNYCNAVLLLTLVTLLIFFISTLFSYDSFELLGIVGFVLVRLAIITPLLFFHLRFMALRVHDLNFNGYWSLIALVPFINTAFVIAMFFVPGSRGSNRYGPPSAHDRPLITVVLAALNMLSYTVYTFWKTA